MLAIAFLLVASAHADDRVVVQDVAREMNLSAEQQNKLALNLYRQKVIEATKEFQGLKLGLGFAITQNIGDGRVESAEVVDSKVRVTDERDNAIRAVGEIHRFNVKDNPDTCNATDVSGCARWGHGPFFSLQTGTNDVIESAGLGYMVGFRQVADKSQSLNIGVGLVLDPRVKRLGDDIRENEPLPGKETTIRFKQTSGWSVVVAVSFGFGS
jgi:hypothetical protein